MKKTFALFACLFVFSVSLSAQAAPTAREIGDVYIENTGGSAAWLALKSLKVKGTAAMQGMEFPMELTSAEGDKQYLLVDVQGQSIIQAYDGTIAWQVMPFMGINEPTEMSEEESEQMRNTHFLSEFIHTEERGFQLEAVEGKEVEGTPTYGVRVTDTTGYDMTYYFDQEYLVPIMASLTVKSGPQKGVVVETYMSDYQEVENLMMPMFLEVKYNGSSIQKITIKETILNPEVKADLFSLPSKQ